MSIDAGVLFEFQHAPESQILPKLSKTLQYPLADLFPLIPLLLSWLVYPSTAAERDTLKDLSNETRDQLADFLTSRLTAAPPSTSDPLRIAPGKRAALFHYHGVMLNLPKEHIEPYRDALTRMAWTSTAEQRRKQRAAWTCDCRYLLEFLDSSQARVPHSNLELVAHGRRYASSDPRGCWDQLVRFPELTIEPIRAVLRRGDDGGWAANILSFLLSDVPPALMERLRPEIERIAQRPTDDEIECTSFEYAAYCLEAMDHWAARMKILPRLEVKLLHAT
ncbi:hypothetical protein B0H14DRAFT_3050307 [Mycena olivaceomarginata]|nr:hypothetical protein B0H14DRAFT_3050307 [Mycena olivaceomarginata]